jgi:hypothetical protein
MRIVHTDGFIESTIISEIPDNASLERIMGGSFYCSHGFLQDSLCDILVVKNQETKKLRKNPFVTTMRKKAGINESVFGIAIVFQNIPYNTLI